MLMTNNKQYNLKYILLYFIIIFYYIYLFKQQIRRHRYIYE